MIKFETKVVYHGLSSTNLNSFKSRLRSADVPFADISSYYNPNRKNRYLVLWFSDKFEENVFARTLDGKLQKVVKECAKSAGMYYEDTHA